MDLNTIMSNIYGENASQNFDSLGVTGGHRSMRGGNSSYSNSHARPPYSNASYDGIYGDNSAINSPTPQPQGLRPIRRQARVKYLDEPKSYRNYSSGYSGGYSNDYSGADYSYKANKIFPTVANMFKLTGGAKGDSDKIYPSAEYVDNDDLKTFIREFFLHYLVSNIHSNTILIVPPHDTLKKMVDDFKSNLKSENIGEYTPEASKYAAKTDLPFKNYIFDVYGRNSPDNEGFPYQVSSEFPNSGMSEVLRRTNRLSKPYFFSFESIDSIKVATNEKMTGASKLKFLAKADRDCFILTGEVPSDSGKHSSEVESSLSGGSRQNRLKSTFMSFVRRFNDLDTAAYNFIGAVGASNGNDANSINSMAKKLSKYYSGDFVHAAFSILANANEFNGNPDPVDERTLTEVHSAIIDNYTPRKSVIKMDKVNDVLPRIFKNCKRAANGLQASKSFISTIQKMYESTNASKTDMLADIGTAMCKHNGSFNSVRNALHVMDAVNAMSNGEGEGQESYLTASLRMGGNDVSSPLISAVYGAISSSPFIGSVAREYTPMLMSSSKRSRSSFKPNKSFEDAASLNHESAVEFSILNAGKEGEEEIPVIDVDKKTGNTEADNSGQPFQEFDIKSFF